MSQETGPESDRGQSGASSPAVSGPFLLIQMLRGVAALMVVWHHATLMENERLDPARGVWLSGAGGVDIFFVISGFVMVFSSWSLRTAAHPMRTFLQRRIERVVPMYWLVTTVKVIAACLVPSVAARLFNGLWHLVASYLFLPSVNGAGAVHPVLIVGWTLNYEAAFYVLVAIGLGRRLRLVPYLLAVLPALGLVGWLMRGTLPTVLSEVNPLLLEFAYGVLLAGALPVLRARRRWPMVVSLLGLIFGFLLFQLTPQEVVRADRPLVWGFAALMIVGAALALEERAGRWVPGWLLAIGNASYSNYLIHTLVLAGLGSLWSRVGMGSHDSWLVGTVLCVVICTLAAQIVYLVVELPITQFFRRRRGRA